MRDVTILVPLYDETDALMFSKYYFDSLNVPVIYAIDQKCLPATRRLVQTLGVRAVEFQNSKPFIENGYEAFAAASPTDWIFRVDCDEVPTMEAVSFARKVDVVDGCVVAFQRHQVVWRTSSFLRPQHDRFAPDYQKQYRLFNRRSASFDSTIHTPGISVGCTIVAPPEAALYHLSWIFLSDKQRFEKVRRYDANGQRASNRENQLFPLDYPNWERLPRNQVDAIFQNWMQAQATR